MNKYFNYDKELQFEKYILDNMCYREKVEITNNIIDRLVLCREIFKDSVRHYTEYSKRIVRLRYINMYYEKQAFITEIKSKYNKEIYKNED